jgi:septation ring formation regulator EzrA
LKALKATVERQKHQLRTKSNALMRTREELEQSKQQYSEIEQELEERQEELLSLRKNEKQYRNWWLNEVQFTKLLLNQFPEPNRDIELVRRSQAHYLGHY